MDRFSTRRTRAARGLTLGWVLQAGALVLGIVRAASGGGTWNAVPFLLLGVWALGAHVVVATRRAIADGT